MIKSFIKDCDNQGIEASLYYNKNDKIVKSIYGGILSILIMLLILAGGSFFFYQFVTRENFTLVSNSAVINDVNYKDFSKIPFMIRLAGKNGLLYPKGYYYVKMKAYNNVPGTPQTSKNYAMEPCDINKEYFAEKKELFKSTINFENYLCPVFEKDEFELRGIYGSADYSFIVLAFFFCVNNEVTGITGCVDFNHIMKTFEDTYVDFISITNSIDHYNAIPYEEKLYQVRIPTSDTIFKRIWLYYERLIYKTDTGYLFESINTDTIFSIKKYSEDIDLREFSNNIFLIFTFVNYESTTTYTKSYMKAPTLLANIGGIIKGLTLIGYILNYPIAVNLFNLSLINTIYDKENSFEKIHQRNSFSPPDNNNRLGIQNNDLQAKKVEVSIVNAPSINIADTVNNNLISIQNANLLQNRNNFNTLNNNYMSNSANHNILRDNNNSNSMIKNNNSNNRHDNFLNREAKRNVNNYISYSETLDNKNEDNLNSNYSKNLNTKKLPSIKKQHSSSNFSKFTSEKTILKRNTFTLSCLNMLDPFQICLNSKKKKQYLNRLKQAQECLNINNLITNFQELNLIKYVLFEENQLVLLENLNRLNPDLEKMTIAYNNIISKEYQINKIQSDKNINYNNNNNSNNDIEDVKYIKSYVDYNNNKTLDEKNLNSKLISLVDF